MEIDIWSIPRYAETVAHEQQLRDGAFLGLNEWINGVEAKPFAPEHHNILTELGSPFIVNSERQPRPGDILVFLWIVSPRWRPQNTLLGRWAKRRFFRSLRDINFQATVRALDQYIADAFYDAPRIDRKSKATVPRPKSYSSHNAILAHEFGTAYGWTDEKILRTPYKRLFQCRKWMSTGPKSNPSDRIIREHCEKNLQRAPSNPALVAAIAARQK